MDHPSRRTSPNEEVPKPTIIASHPPVILLILLALFGPLFATTSGAFELAALFIFTFAFCRLASAISDRKVNPGPEVDAVVYMLVSCIAAPLTRDMFSNFWVRLIATYAVCFLSMGIYMQYKQSKTDASKLKQKRNRQLAEYLGEPVQAAQDVSVDEAKSAKDVKDVSAPKARKGPSTRLRG